MYMLIVFMALLVLFYLTGKYTNLQTEQDNKFLLVSSVLFVLIFIFLFNLLLDPSKFDTDAIHKLTMDPKTFSLVIAYMVWYFTSSVIINKLNLTNTVIPFYTSNNQWVSTKSTLYD